MRPLTADHEQRIAAQQVIRETEKKIAALLAELEATTGQLVERVDISDIEITNMEDTREEMLRRVCITLRRLPGSRWE